MNLPTAYWRTKFKNVLMNRHKIPLYLNPIWAGFWNDVVGWGGALSAQVSVLEGSPLRIFLATCDIFEKKIFLTFLGCVLHQKKQSQEIW